MGKKEARHVQAGEKMGIGYACACYALGPLNVSSMMACSMSVAMC